MSYSEQALRNEYIVDSIFPPLIKKLVSQNCSDELILAFDPSYIFKSGKHTEGLGYYWSG